MFGLSFGEFVVLVVLLVVVVGPRNLPSMLRELGRWVGKLRRLTTDLRAQSGIDQMAEIEELRREISHLRAVASGGLVLDLADPVAPRPPTIDREREYPAGGPDAYGAIAEDLVPYRPAEPTSTTTPTPTTTATATPTSTPTSTPSSTSSPTPTAPEPRSGGVATNGSAGGPQGPLTAAAPAAPPPGVAAPQR